MDKSLINRHVASVHKGKKSFKCNDCEYSASTKLNLKKSDLDNLAKDLSSMIKADGIIALGEMNLAGLLKYKLGIDINIE